MLSQKKQAATSLMKKLFFAGIALGVANLMAREVSGQAVCDSRTGSHARYPAGLSSGEGCRGEHAHCKSLTVLDRIDSVADRLETGLDRVFGKLLPKKKQCHCVHCRAQAAEVIPESVPAEGVPVPDRPLEWTPEPHDPAIADPLNLPLIESNPEGASGAVPSDETSSVPETIFRPRVPLKEESTRRQFPAKTDRMQENPGSVGPKLPAIELRPMEAAPPSSPRKNTREPGVYIPEWLDDPFKEDQSRREEKLRQRLLAPENPPKDVRMSQQPSSRDLMQQPQSRPVAVAEQSKQKVEPVGREPVIRLNVGAANVASAADKAIQRSDSNVIKASANQPIRITFPTKK